MAGPDVRQRHRGRASHRQYVECPVRELWPLGQHRRVIGCGYPADYYRRHPTADLGLDTLREAYYPADGRACPQHEHAAASGTVIQELDAFEIGHVRTVLQPR